MGNERYTNVASGNAVVGQMIGRQAPGTQVFAWVRDDGGRLWVFAGLRPDGMGGLYATDAGLPAVLAGEGPGWTISQVSDRVGVSLMGPSVTPAAR